MIPVQENTAPRIALVGATGVVDGTLIELIRQRCFRYRDPQLVASARSAGHGMTVEGRSHQVQDLAGFDFSSAHRAGFADLLGPDEAVLDRPGKQGGIGRRWTTRPGIFDPRPVHVRFYRVLRIEAEQ